LTLHTGKAPLNSGVGKPAGCNRHPEWHGLPGAAVDRHLVLQPGSPQEVVAVAPLIMAWFSGGGWGLLLSAQEGVYWDAQEGAGMGCWWIGCR